jgi:hypothetical protein
MEDECLLQRKRPRHDKLTNYLWRRRLGCPQKAGETPAPQGKNQSSYFDVATNYLLKLKTK